MFERRRGGLPVAETHMGKIPQGRPLASKEDFASWGRQASPGGLQSKKLTSPQFGAGLQCMKNQVYCAPSGHELDVPHFGTVN